MTPILETKNLECSFWISTGIFSPKKALAAVNGVSVQLLKGQVLGLVGESGSGKSTLGKAIAGLIEKTSGEIKYRGKVLPTKYTAKDFQSQATEIQMIFQADVSSKNERTNSILLL